MIDPITLEPMTDADLVRLVQHFWGRYMYEECAERGYNAQAASEANRAYLLHAAEARRRGINPFAGVPYPEHSWPADFYREAVARGEITTAKTL